ncbi:hypothetical protein H9L13_02125 [Sphingomonas lutea]|uniref:Uncharacterized protein n=1 Tax=Sphingomonas lutea TaxID=1045317 RepID=A0A7G9SIS8_9SPHN|nr:hypothetical protein [Sphingomonas lutea]QNN67753.1 hypothetical protein H9L13_02125 [Sphingomonas lutea]
MVIRRIREHAAQQNWFSVAIDLLIVGVGVFLGMQASNWNDARIERQQSESYRIRLVEDLRANESDLQQRRAYYRQVRSHALAALEVLELPPRPAGEQFLIDAYQATQVVPRTLSRFTYDEMIAAGGVDRLDGADLRKRVKNYYSGIETAETTFRTIPPYREHLRRVMPYLSQRQIRTHCREALGTSSSGEQMNILPKSCRLALDSSSISKAVAQVRSSPGITADLTRYLIDLELKLDLFDLLEGRARNLRQALQEQTA